MSNVIAELGNAVKRDDVPDFRAGDTIKVHVKVVEGNRSRIQVFQGVVIRIHGSGIGRTFTVRKVSFGVGVERTGEVAVGEEAGVGQPLGEVRPLGVGEGRVVDGCGDDALDVGVVTPHRVGLHEDLGAIELVEVGRIGLHQADGEVGVVAGEGEPGRLEEVVGRDPTARRHPPERDLQQVLDARESGLAREIVADIVD